MKTRVTGIVLAIIGIVMIVYTGFNYVTTKKVIDMGPMHMNVDQNHLVQWSPILGIILLVGGILVVIIDRKRAA